MAAAPAGTEHVTARETAAAASLRLILERYETEQANRNAAARQALGEARDVVAGLLSGQHAKPGMAAILAGRAAALADQGRAYAEAYAASAGLSGLAEIAAANTRGDTAPAEYVGLSVVAARYGMRLDTLMQKMARHPGWPPEDMHLNSAGKDGGMQSRKRRPDRGWLPESLTPGGAWDTWLKSLSGQSADNEDEGSE